MSFNFKNDPFENFLELYREAQIRGVPDANAMSLATVNEENQTSVRVVLFKGIIENDNSRGFSFYTNYKGRKARDIEFNNKISVNFFWPHLEEQIRIQGVAEKLSRTQSENYFSTRPRLSQIGAWASHQSEEIESFESFKSEFKTIEKKFKGEVIPCPPNWGGYCILPTEFEFWFGKNGRLHERYVYQKISTGWHRLLKSP